MNSAFTYFRCCCATLSRIKSKTIYAWSSTYSPVQPAPEDNTGRLRPEGDRAVPPYEALGCLSGYRMQTGSIVQVAARELGDPRGTFNVFSARGGRAIAGMTCETLTDEEGCHPDDRRTAGPRLHQVVSLVWHHDLPCRMASTLARCGDRSPPLAEDRPQSRWFCGRWRVHRARQCCARSRPFPASA